VDDSVERVSPVPDGGSAFRTTLWTEVLLAGNSGSPSSTAALERLCGAYWYPLYAFIRRQGYDPHEAQDLTQAFFGDLLSKKFLTAVDREKGRFRSYLLARLKNFLANEWTYRNRQKRGGGQKLFSLDEAAAEGRYADEPRDNATPEVLFERRWAQTILDEVFRKLAGEYEGPEPAQRFAELKRFLIEPDEAESYAAVATRLGMRESAVKSAIYRLRQRYRELFRAEIASTVGTSSEVDEEIRYLFAALRA
jgi:DNA-directed RNA polymerase specialized sigma24 family protein